MQDFGKLLMILGLTAAGIGLLLWLGVGKSWLGRMPGDIAVQKPNFSFYFPITTCIIISVILTLIFWLFRPR
jgi:membrane protein implicated in regulation of membrane protease activity